MKEEVEVYYLIKLVFIETSRNSSTGAFDRKRVISRVTRNKRGIIHILRARGAMRGVKRG